MLIQIEEPAPPSDELVDPGLAIGIELTEIGLGLAISVGGNLEILRGADGDIAFLPALAGYDEDGGLAAGSTGLADASGIGLAALSALDAVDARGTGIQDRLTALIRRAAREIMMRAKRLVTRGVAVVPLGLSAGGRGLLLLAIEAAGIDVLQLVETPVAIAYAAGLDEREAGLYLFLAPAGDLISAAWLAVEPGRIRLIGTDLVGKPDFGRLKPDDAVVLGVVAPDLASPEIVAAELNLPLLPVGIGVGAALAGAALLADRLA